MKNKAQKQGTPASHYTKDYYFSGEYYGSANEYKLFTKGGKPAAVYLRALSYLQNNSSGKFLDVGCGRGELVLHLARLGRSAIGIDYSKSAIEICQDTLIKEKAPVRRLGQFKLANVTNLPFQAETFDAVFMLDVVEHLTKEETEKALSELKRVLKKGGRIIVHTNNKFLLREQAVTRLVPNSWRISFWVALRERLPTLLFFDIAHCPFLCSFILPRQ
jgi:ubiquinone/menaquinone biosynthesis C-methylase UbiE